jgi:hypothetical protein
MTSQSACQTARPVRLDAAGGGEDDEIAVETDLISTAPYLTSKISSAVSTAQKRSNNGHSLS